MGSFSKTDHGRNAVKKSGNARLSFEISDSALQQWKNDIASQEVDSALNNVQMSTQAGIEDLMKAPGSQSGRQFAQPKRQTSEPRSRYE